MQKLAFDIPASDDPDVTIAHRLDTADVIVQVYEKVGMQTILRHPQVEILDNDSVRITLRWVPGLLPNTFRVVIIG